MPTPEQHGRGGRPYVRPLVVGLLVLVAAAGVYARAHTSFSFTGPPRLSSALVTVTFLVVEVVGLVFLVLALVLRGERRRRQRRGRASWATTFLVVLLGMVLLWAFWFVRRSHELRFGSGFRPHALPNAHPTASPGRSLTGTETTLWLAWACLLALTVAVVAVVLWRRAHPPAPPPVAEDEAAEEPDAAAEALRAGRAALDTSTDPRTAVIACYEAMEQTLASAGVARAPAQTPEELLAVARHRGALTSGRAAEALVELFGRARFSSRPVDAADVAAARRALAELLAERAEGVAG